MSEKNKKQRYAFADAKIYLGDNLIHEERLQVTLFEDEGEDKAELFLSSAAKDLANSMISGTIGSITYTNDADEI